MYHLNDPYRTERSVSVASVTEEWGSEARMYLSTDPNTLPQLPASLKILEPQCAIHSACPSVHQPSSASQ